MSRRKKQKADDCMLLVEDALYRELLEIELRAFQLLVLASDLRRLSPMFPRHQHDEEEE